MAEGVKNELDLAALPSTDTQMLIERLKPDHEQYVPAANVLAISIEDRSYAIHPVTTLLNLARLETIGPYKTHHYDVTPQTCRMVEAVDAERCMVAEAFGIKIPCLVEQVEIDYGLRGETFYESMTQPTVHRDQITPSGANHRYVTEELPYGLIPLLQLGARAGILMPATNAIVTVGSVVNAVDYRMEGRNLATIGLKDLSVDEILSRL